MCLAIPSRVIQIKDKLAKVDVDGVVREASLMLLDDVKIGDYVIVHAGFALNIIDEDEAIKTLELMKEVLDNPNTEMTWDTKTAG